MPFALMLNNSMVNQMKTTNDLVMGQLVEIVKHTDSPYSEDCHLSNYPGFEVGTRHIVCDNSDVTGSSVMISSGKNCIIVEAEEIEPCIN